MNSSGTLALQCRRTSSKPLPTRHAGNMRRGRLTTSTRTSSDIETNKTFRACFDALPSNIQRRAKQAYQIFTQDPLDPRLHFERKHAKEEIWSVWIGPDYRAIGVKPRDDLIVWFWIGSHSDYDKLLP